MATKKAAPAKTSAKGAKSAKPAAKAPVKKVAAKTNAKPAAKAPAAKKPAPVPAKKAAVKTAKPAAPVKKTTPKEAPKAAAKAAPAVKKPMAKATPAAPAKKVVPAKPAPKAPEPVKKPSVTAPSKEEAKTATKPLEKKASKPAPKAEPARPTKVVIPKTSTTNSVKYQPDFTKSVLDTPAHQEQQGPTMRYSDAELMEFRELINKKLDTAKKELAYLQGLITRRDESGDLDEGRYMTMEDGSMSMEREQLSQMASRQIQFIDHLEKALMRIENKTYGVCRVTGKLIDKARLRAVPHATLSIEAKQMRMR